MGASVQPQAAGAPSDADLWDQYVAQKMSPHEATARIEASHGAAPDVIWDKLIAQGAPADSATAIVGRVTGKQPPGSDKGGFNPLAIPREAIHDIASIPAGWAGLPAQLAGAIRGAQGIGDAMRSGNAAAIRQEPSPAQAGTGAVYGAAQKVAAGAEPIRAGLANMADQIAKPASDAELGLEGHPVLAALAHAGIGAATSYGMGKLLSKGTDWLATRAQAPIVDKTLKTEANDAYDAMRAGPPVTDPEVLKEANAFNQKPQGQEAFKAGQADAFAKSGRQVPDLPQATRYQPRSMLQRTDPFWAKMYGSGPEPITSLTPEQIDAWKRGAGELKMGGAFKPLLEKADAQMPGYAAARGLSEASRQPTPNLADLAVPAAKVATLVAGAATRNPVLTGAGLLSFLAKGGAEREPLSPNAIAALRGVQQQVASLPLSDIYAQGGAVPAAFSGIAHMAPWLPATAIASAQTQPGASP